MLCRYLYFYLLLHNYCCSLEYLYLHSKYIFVHLKLYRVAKTKQEKKMEGLPVE